jgi:hypothetical protein
MEQHARQRATDQPPLPQAAAAEEEDAVAAGVVAGHGIGLDLEAGGEGLATGGTTCGGGTEEYAEEEYAERIDGEEEVPAARQPSGPEWAWHSRV